MGLYTCTVVMSNEGDAIFINDQVHRTFQSGADPMKRENVLKSTQIDSANLGPNALISSLANLANLVVITSIVPSSSLTHFHLSHHSHCRHVAFP